MYEYRGAVIGLSFLSDSPLRPVTRIAVRVDFEAADGSHVHSEIQGSWLARGDALTCALAHAAALIERTLGR